MISLSALLVLMAPGAVSGQSKNANAWGIYVAPATHRFRKANTEYELFQTNTRQDFGIFVSHLILHKVNAQLEVRYSTRNLDVGFDDVAARLSEEFVEVPLILQATRIRTVDTVRIRMYMGVGVSYSWLVKQEIDTFGSSSLPPEIHTGQQVDRYSKMGLVGEGGVVLFYRRHSGIFMGYRISSDLATFGKSNSTVAPKYVTYGFQLGFEWRFDDS